MSLTSSAARVFDTLLDLLRVRAELLAVDVEEELLRTTSLLVRAMAALLLALLALVFVSLGVVAYYWDTAQRLVAILALAAVYAVVCGMVVATVLRDLRTKPRFLDATLRMFEEDRQNLAPAASLPTTPAAP
jgi:uncharacterized membrane protein YqjE